MSEKKADVPVKASEVRPVLREPFKMLEAMEQEMSRLWREGWPFGPWLAARPRRLFEAPTMGAVWVPQMDVYEKDGKLVVKAELPGMKKEDVEVTVEEGDLVIKGERKTESEVKQEDYYRSERSYGSFYRRVPLPEGVDPEKATATYADGILEIDVPLPAKPKQTERKIPVA
jgi:HSP20 family protein